VSAAAAASLFQGASDAARPGAGANAPEVREPVGRVGFRRGALTFPRAERAAARGRVDAARVFFGAARRAFFGAAFRAFFGAAFRAAARFRTGAALRAVLRLRGEPRDVLRAVPLRAPAFREPPRPVFFAFLAT
jgi:hypothetical protein